MESQVAPSPNRLAVIGSLFAVYVIWGSTYLAMRWAVEGLPPFLMAGTRFVLTGTILFTFLKLRGAPTPTRAEWLYSLPVGVLMFVLGNGTVAMAEKHVSSSIAAVVCGSMPLWVGALGPLFGVRTSGREWVGLGIGFLGVLVLGLGGELRAEPASAALLMIAPASWALGSLLARFWPLPKGLMSAATQMLTGGVSMSIVSALHGDRLPDPLPTRAMWAWVYLAVFGSLVAYSAYTYLLRATRPAVATSYSYVNPVVAVFFGVFFANEKLNMETIVSLVLITISTLLVLRARGPVTPATPANSAAVTEA